jgi:hypothetical protein
MRRSLAGEVLMRFCGPSRPARTVDIWPSRRTLAMSYVPYPDSLDLR